MGLLKLRWGGPCWLLITCRVGVGAVLVAGCDAVTIASAPDPGIARGGVEERLGRYDGVRLGQPKLVALRRLGPAPGATPPPAGGVRVYADQADQPEILPADGYPPGPPTLDKPKDRADAALYPDVLLTFADARVASITVYGEGARTARGVEVGDSLDMVRERYRDAAGGLRCAPPEDGHGYRLSSRCMMRLGRHFLFFGGDPVKVIALSTIPFERGVLR